MSEVIRKFQLLITHSFRELVLASAYLKIGHGVALNASPDASTSLVVGLGVTTEPIRLRELLIYNNEVAFGIAELFQSKAIAAWADLLNDMFAFFAEQHISGARPVAALKRRSAKLDFSSEIGIQQQLINALVNHFAFDRYADRIKTIQAVIPVAGIEHDLELIRRHVLIRHANQHHGGEVYSDLLKELGAQDLKTLDGDANEAAYAQGQRIRLHVPELNRLKSALFVVSNAWRAELATLSDGSNS